MADRASPEPRRSSPARDDRASPARRTKERSRSRSRSPPRREKRDLDDRRDRRGADSYHGGGDSYRGGDRYRGGGDRDRGYDNRDRDQDRDRDRHRDQDRDRPRKPKGGGGFKWKQKGSGGDREEDNSRGGRVGGYRNRSPRRHPDREERAAGADSSSSSKPRRDRESKPAPAPAPVATDGEEMIIVHVNDRLGTKAAIPCFASDKIREFKIMVAARIGREPHEILLKRQGERPFKDHLALEDYGISNGVQIDLEVDTGD